MRIIAAWARGSTSQKPREFDKEIHRIVTLLLSLRPLELFIAMAMRWCDG